MLFQGKRSTSTIVPSSSRHSTPGPPRAAGYKTPAEEREEPRQNQAALDRSFSSAAESRNVCPMNFRVEIEQEDDGRWIAEVVDLPGVLAYGSTSKEAQARVQALALRVVADRLEHGEADPGLVNISFAAA